MRCSLLNKSRDRLSLILTTIELRRILERNMYLALLVGELGSCYVEVAKTCVSLCFITDQRGRYITQSDSERVTAMLLTIG